MNAALILSAMALQPVHAGHQPTPPAEAKKDEDAADHEKMDHDMMGHGAADQPVMDHGAMGHGAAAGDKLEGIPIGPPPRAAGSGPAREAERIFGADAMREARAALIHETGQQSFLWVQADRAEARFGGDSVGFLWDAQASYGPDLDELWIESEGEGDLDEGIESADIEATWSRAIAPFWDLQIGARQDLAGSSRTYATVGVQGLAPYLFEVDAAAYLSTEGEMTAEIEAELDQRITQRLILQPRGELVFSAQDIPDLALGSGLAKAELGLRLRYEFAREFAPYIGIAQEWRVGDSRDFARAAGEDASATRFVAGLRFWF
ncbi:copper resistance protein B [Sphingomicrobium sediminis]|uniref:Copper resistance protein B n=1 Tax=Sphingomicrobium sediminis TaxID=2950949 RepID=A0A9X2EMY1_9SPHN|nr:copper resistance protein B [Sphingomicrobium sediminis]MCM8558329.1 copper resistance protein B [Sphingomicrobium sediminis]